MSFNFVNPEVPTDAEFLRAFVAYLKTDSDENGAFIHFWRRYAGEHRLQNRQATFTHWCGLSLPSTERELGVVWISDLFRR
jgi:hypothetical protein